MQSFKIQLVQLLIQPFHLLQPSTINIVLIKSPLYMDWSPWKSKCFKASHYLYFIVWTSVVQCSRIDPMLSAIVTFVALKLKCLCEEQNIKREKSKNNNCELNFSLVQKKCLFYYFKGSFYLHILGNLKFFSFRRNKLSK